jgi:hypothetical protein
MGRKRWAKPFNSFLSQRIKSPVIGHWLSRGVAKLFAEQHDLWSIQLSART